jgi:hypothetical protein
MAYRINSLLRDCGDWRDADASPPVVSIDR